MLRSLVIAIVIVSATLVAAQSPTPALTDLQRLEAQVHLLRVENAQLRAAYSDVRAKLDGLELSAERADMVERFRIQLKATPAAAFDWTTLQFTEQPANQSAATPIAPKPPR